MSADADRFPAAQNTTDTQQITGEVSAHLYSEVGLQALITTGAYNINASEDL